MRPIVAADHTAGARRWFRTGQVLPIGAICAVGRLLRSDGFAAARQHAVHSRLPWFVLSAQRGLLDPHDVISPYELLIDDQPAVYRSAWGEWVVAQLADRVQLDGVVVEVHGGVDFAQPLRHPLARRGAVLEIPCPVPGGRPSRRTPTTVNRRTSRRCGSLPTGSRVWSPAAVRTPRAGPTTGTPPPAIRRQGQV